MSEQKDFEADYISGVIYKFEVNSEVKFEDYRAHCAWAGWQARAARTATAEPVAYRGMPNDFITHQDTWRQALERLIELEPESVEGQVDDKAFWRHELAAFDRAYAELEVARTAPAEGTTSYKYRAELYDEVWQKARDMGYGNVTDALAEVERLKEEADESLRANQLLWREVERLRGEVERLRIAAKYSEEVDATPENQRETILYDTLVERDALKADAERFTYVLSQIPANLGEIFCQCITATDDDIIEAIDAARTAKPEVKS